MEAEPCLNTEEEEEDGLQYAIIPSLLDFLRNTYS